MGWDQAQGQIHTRTHTQLREAANTMTLIYVMHVEESVLNKGFWEVSKRAQINFVYLRSVDEKRSTEIKEQAAKGESRGKKNKNGTPSICSGGVNKNLFHFYLSFVWPFCSFCSRLILFVCNWPSYYMRTNSIAPCHNLVCGQTLSRTGWL